MTANPHISGGTFNGPVQFGAGSVVTVSPSSQPVLAASAIESTDVTEPRLAEPFVMVSYASPDREIAVRLATQLAGAGVDCWFDRAIRPGDVWPSALETAVRTCRAMVLLASPAAAASTWVNKEVTVMVERAGLLLPVELAAASGWLLIAGIQRTRLDDRGLLPDTAIALLRAAAA